MNHTHFVAHFGSLVGFATAVIALAPACGGSPSAAPNDAGVDTSTATDAGSGVDSTVPIDASETYDAGADTSFTGHDDAGDAGSTQDFTFFAFGDPQYGGGPYDKNTYNILALNSAADMVWPAGQGFAFEGSKVGAPRGVLIAGDLTQNGQAGRNRDLFTGEWYTADRYSFDINAQYGLNVPNPDTRAELGLFLRDYGLRGSDGLNPLKLTWRVFEGYGNHDFDILANDVAHYGGQAPSRDSVSIRNRVRASWPEMRRFAQGNAGHYSWTWDGVHIVHMNLVATDSPPLDGDSNAHFRDPQGALSFLRDDLAAEVGASCAPVVVIMHYGLDDFGDESRWWDDAQRAVFFDVVRPYNVVALLHGHTHETRHYNIVDAAGKTYEVFSLGSPYYQGQQTNNGRGHFAAFHFREGHIDAADISWLPANPDPAEGDNKDLWTGKTLTDLSWQLTTTFADGWGGWKYSKDIDTSACKRGYPDGGVSDAGDASAIDASDAGDAAHD